MTLQTKRDIERAHQELVRGDSLRDLAARYDMTHEGIRKLFQDHGLSTDERAGRKTKRQEQEVEVWRRKDEIFASYRKHGTIEKVAAETKLPPKLVSPVVAQMPLRNAYRRKGKRNEHSREDIIAELHRAVGILMTDNFLTTTAYRKIAPAHKLPALYTITRIFGDWGAACEAAGIEHNPIRGRYAESLTEADCLEGIRVAARELGHTPSYDEYRKWQRGRNLPSGPTIRVIVGPWTEAIVKALG